MNYITGKEIFDYDTLGLTIIVILFFILVVSLIWLRLLTKES